MEKLIIKTPERSVEIGLFGEAMSITVDRSEPAATQGNLEWSHTLLDGDAVTYEKAEKAIADLGPGWRLPTRQELEPLLDLSRDEPAIDTEKFPDTRSRGYWTSTPCAFNDAAVWVVLFGVGLVYYYHRNDGACVRAVRSGQ
ncbi:DUF1566 domain-containing protein [Marinobacter sp. Hex_13]|uniref:Lcl C-terminal domain-containing protein n=1 Tax=Marinobacter sp. Hex_13 TaxID=1795866 RepID=UPI000793009E|nr:DUF1566 domain-containing protein [Marinobacter sp. Hex_13]KXJ45852.1 MAG: hypothetical protein AXW11_12235 [Marinobacter sp. Hex_13]